MLDSKFYDIGTLEKIAIDLFYGWGYNFYRLENQLRFDDLLIRQRACLLLNAAKLSISKAESQYRKEFIKTPTRENPFPSAETVSVVTALSDFVICVAKVEAYVRALPVPEKDRFTNRYRHEAETMVALSKVDLKLIGQAEVLRVDLDSKDATWILENRDLINVGLNALDDTIKERQLLIS